MRLTQNSIMIFGQQNTAGVYMGNEPKASLSVGNGKGIRYQQNILLSKLFLVVENCLNFFGGRKVEKMSGSLCYVKQFSKVLKFLVSGQY